MVIVTEEEKIMNTKVRIDKICVSVQEYILGSPINWYVGAKFWLQMTCSNDLFDWNNGGSWAPHMS